MHKGAALAIGPGLAAGATEESQGFAFLTVLPCMEACGRRKSDTLWRR
jgi:hypothetical protein